MMFRNRMSETSFLFNTKSVIATILIVIVVLVQNCENTKVSGIHNDFKQILLNNNSAGQIPIIINTWGFVNATQFGWNDLLKNQSALDAIVTACSKCEQDQCDHTVGWGGSPDENGETTLDAMIMDGPSHKVGSVAALRNVKDVIKVARAVLEHTEHTLLVGDQATEFALRMGFERQNLTSAWSKARYEQWRENKCQPNYWLNVTPDPNEKCGPYKPIEIKHQNIFDESCLKKHIVNQQNHDTIGVVAIDSVGRIASGTSTNGMIHKIPGRVGDSPIAGAGSYVDQDVGGAAATGDGDIIMRFLTSYQTVENMRQGMSPTKAAQNALSRILTKFNKAQVGIVAIDMQGNYGAACIGIEGGFPFSVATLSINPTKAIIQHVKCIN